MQRESIRSQVSEQEWQIRCELAALYRLLAHFRMTDMIYTHVSARLPGAGDVFLLNRYGVLFENMRASDLVRVDVDGRILEDDPAANPVIAAGFIIHSAIHMARPDALFVIHTHTQAGIAVSAQKRGLLPISQHAMKFYRGLSYHEYEGIAIERGERERLAANLGANFAMILRNHGLLTAGRSAGEAFSHLYFLERACQVQVSALAGGGELFYPSQAVIEKTADQWAMRMGDVSYFSRFWGACLQLVEGDALVYCS